MSRTPRWTVLAFMLTAVFVLQGDVRVAGATTSMAAPTAAPPEKRTVAELLHLATQAYQNEEYKRAVDFYRKLNERGVETGDLWYNLGNAELRAGSIGKAIASYLRAKRHLPRDEDVAANVRYARQQRVDQLEAQTGRAGPIEVLFFWHFDLSNSELLVVALVANILAWLLLGVRLWFHNDWLSWIAAMLLLVAAATAGSWAIHEFAPRQIAVVTANEVGVRAGTHNEAVLLFELHDGAEATVTDETDDWVKIRISDDKRGWLPMSAVEVVSI